MSAGFYKVVGGAINHAPKRIITGEGTFKVSEHESYQYPLAGGWYYFDSAEDAESYFNATVSDDVPRVNGVPVEVTPAQCDLALNKIGKLDILNSIIDSDQTPSEVRIRYRKATAIRRDSPDVALLGAALGLSNADIDNLFIEAAKL